MDEYKSMKEPKIKQIMPVPEQYRVLSRVTVENGEIEILDLTDDGFCYILALVQHPKYGDYVVPYSFDQYGMGEIDEDALLIPKRFCPDCHKEIPPKYSKDLFPKWIYTCSCATKSKP
jgi:hypothetical protein